MKRNRTVERAVRAYRRHYDIAFIIGEIFHRQCRSSRSHTYKALSYTQAQLIKFILNQPKAYAIHDEWVKSGFMKSMKLSVDRIDATKGYSLDNIQVMTWGENDVKGRSENRTGIPVLRYTKNGEFIAEHISQTAAAKELGICSKHISDCCKHKRKSTGGYKWEYKF